MIDTNAMYDFMNAIESIAQTDIEYEDFVAITDTLQLFFEELPEPVQAQIAEAMKRFAHKPVPGLQVTFQDK